MTGPAEIAPAAGEGDAYSRVDLSFSLWKATLIALGLTPLIAAVVLGPHMALWGAASLFSKSSLLGHAKVLLLAVIVSVVVHEGLHAAGYVMFGGLAWRGIRFGFSLRSMAAYVHSDVPVTASAYRKLTLLPAIVLGVIPACIGVGWGWGAMTIYGFLMLISASGDFAIIWSVRSLASDALVIDHPTRAGCWALVPKK